MAARPPSNAAPPTGMEPFAGFGPLGLGQELQAGLREMGVLEPTEIQQRLVPELLAERDQRTDFIVAAETGAGKTFAFLLPLMERIKRLEAESGGPETRKARPKALILAPTRELASQIAAVAKRLSHSAKMRVVCLTGGVPRSKINRALESPMDIVVSTPGRARELRDEYNKLFLGSVSHVVLDEADVLAGETGGFRYDLERLLRPMETRGSLSTKVWVGATVMPSKEMRQADKRKGSYGRDASSRGALSWIASTSRAKGWELRKLQSDNAGKLPEGLTYSVTKFSEYSKHPALRSAFKAGVVAAERREKDSTRTLVFCNSIASCRSTTHTLEDDEGIDGLAVFSVHGDMPPKLRDRQWTAFSRDETELGPRHKVLICTDVAARGLDFDRSVDHIIMFDLPASLSDFAHRIGRTARGNKASGHVSLLAHDTAREQRAVDVLLSAVPHAGATPAQSPGAGPRRREAKRRHAGGKGAKPRLW